MIKLSKEDIYIIHDKDNYNDCRIRFNSLEGIEIIWSIDKAIQLKNQILENQEKAETLDSIIPFLRKELTTEQLGLLKVIADPESMKIRAYLASEKSEPTQ